MKLKLINDICVNSYWKARWLAKADEECCQCAVSCKVRAVINNIGGDSECVITEEEYRGLAN